jgi:hypothetical protein
MIDHVFRRSISSSVDVGGLRIERGVYDGDVLDLSAGDVGHCEDASLPWFSG